MKLLSILENLCIFGAGLTVLGFLSRTIIIHWLNKDVEKYKAKLQNAHDVEMEKLRNELNIRYIEHDIRFRSIYEKQAEIIAETYSLLYELNRSVDSYVAILEQTGEPSKEDKFESVIKAYDDFKTYFYPRKIYFPQNISKEIENLSNTLVRISNEFSQGRWREQSGIPTKDQNYWEETSKMIRETIPPLLRQLENDFQKILGVIDLRGKQDAKEY